MTSTKLSAWTCTRKPFGCGPECGRLDRDGMRLVVCDPRRDGNQNDRVVTRKLSELLYMNKVHADYHRDHGLRTNFCGPYLKIPIR